MKTAARQFGLLITLALVAPLLTLNDPRGFASAGTQIVIGSSTVASVGDVGEISVVLNLAPQDALSEFEIHLSYDPAIVAVEDADAIVMNPRWDAPAGLPILIDASTPGVVVVHAATGDPCPAGGACPLFSFGWRAVANGTSTVSASAFTLTGTQSGQSGILAGVSVAAGTARVGPLPASTATPTPSPTATSPATATPTATPRTATPTPTTMPSQTVPSGGGTPVTAVAGGVATATQAAASTSSSAVPARAPDSGSGLGPPGGLVGEAGMFALLVAALLSFGLIMSSLRHPHAAAATSVRSETPPARSKAEIELDVISHYLQTMEALGTASADINLDDAGPPLPGRE